MPPYPPAAPGPNDPMGTGFIVSRVLAGQTFQDTVAVNDSVVLTVMIPGTDQFIHLRMTPEEALELGRALGQKAGEVINAEVDDDGKPTTTDHRLSRIAAGHGLINSLDAAPRGDNTLRPRTTMKQAGEMITPQGVGNYTAEELAALERTMARPYTPGWLGKAAQELSDRIKAGDVEGHPDGYRPRLCPACGKHLLRSTTGEYACVDPECVNAHGVIAHGLSHKEEPGTIVMPGGWSIPKDQFVDWSTAPVPESSDDDDDEVAYEPITADRGPFRGFERVPFDASSDADGDQEVPTQKVKKVKHNHFSAGMKYGCPACSEMVGRLGLPEEEQ